MKRIMYHSICFLTGILLVSAAGGTPMRGTEGTEEPQECNFESAKILYNGKCESLLESASCRSDQWLILSQNGTAHCSPRHCPFGQLFYHERCVNMKDTNVCPSGQMLYVDFAGTVECDCISGLYFDQTSGKCFREHEQGSCQDSFYLEKNAAGLVRCVRNPCVHDHLVQYEGTCYEKSFRGRCQSNDLHLIDNKVICLEAAAHSIFTYTGIRAEKPCLPGTKKVVKYRNCRKIFRFPRLGSFSVTNAIGGICPADFSNGKDGTCQKCVKLFC